MERKYEKNELPRQITQNDRKNTKGNKMEKHLQTSQSSAEATQIAYIAGLFDGEGSVDYTQRWEKKRKNRPNQYFCFHITCEIGMTNYEVLHWVHETLGYGSFRPRKSDTKTFPNAKPQWRWRCGHRNAYKFAKQMLPYAIVKYNKLKQITDHYDEGT